jgi:uncharacterized iron-regulated membrane protein
VHAKRPLWLLICGALLASIAGGLYLWEKAQRPELDELLRFTSLYIACPLALSVLALFGYFNRK